MSDNSQRDPYVKRYKEATEPIERFLGRVEAKYDRIEKGQERDAGHQEAIDNEKKSAQRVMGYSKKERASMAKVKYGAP